MFDTWLPSAVVAVSGERGLLSMVLSDSELQDLSDTADFSEKDTIWQELKDGRELVKV